MAAEMRDAIDEHSQQWRKRDYVLGFGIGIARGHATIGQIGFDQRRDYAVIVGELTLKGFHRPMQAYEIVRWLG
jgi:adenylate cyclase